MKLNERTWAGHIVSWIIIVKPASFIPISPEEMHRYGHWMLWSGNSDRMIEEKKDFEKKYFPRGFCKVCGQMH